MSKMETVQEQTFQTQKELDDLNIDILKELDIADKEINTVEKIYEDVKKLLFVLNTLVDQGNTVVIIEHNLDVIKSSDWIIDLGPDGGDEGGNIIAMGTPESITKNINSYTGQFLKKYLNN